MLPVLFAVHLFFVDPKQRQVFAYIYLALALGVGVFRWREVLQWMRR